MSGRSSSSALERDRGHIVKGVLARDQVHMSLWLPPQLSLSDAMQRIKGRSLRRIQAEISKLRMTPSRSIDQLANAVPRCALRPSVRTGLHRGSCRLMTAEASEGVRT